MRFLITAIGSMAAECVIKRLKAEGHFVVGCDIYPGEWHYETKLCDVFVKAPFAKRCFANGPHSGCGLDRSESSCGKG